MSEIPKAQVLVLEDQRPQRTRLKNQMLKAAASMGGTCIFRDASTVRRAEALLTGGFTPDLVTVDHGLADSEVGVKLIRTLFRNRRRCRVLVVSSKLTRVDPTGKQDVWEAYTSIRSDIKEAGVDMEIDIYEKRQKENIQGWIEKKLCAVFQPSGKMRLIKRSLLREIPAKSQSMTDAVACIERFLEQWAQRSRNLLVLHGPAGAGKRFVAKKVVTAAGIDLKEKTLEAEAEEFSRPGSFEEVIRNPQPRGLTGGVQVFLVKIKNVSEHWSQIIPDLSEWPTRKSLAQLIADLVSKSPNHLFVWVVDEIWWPTLGPFLMDRLDRTMVDVRIPPLPERREDTPEIAEQILAETEKGRSIKLDKIATAALVKGGPNSIIALRDALVVAAKSLPPSATEIPVSDLPRTWVKRIEIRPVTVRPEEIPADVEERVKKFLVSSINKTTSFGQDFDRLHPDLEGRVIRAIAFISAHIFWEGRRLPTKYPTIFGVEWAAVMRDAPYGRKVLPEPPYGRPYVTAFADKHREYLLSLAAFGPRQPKPEAELPMK